MSFDIAGAEALVALIASYTISFPLSIVIKDILRYRHDRGTEREVRHERLQGARAGNHREGRDGRSRSVQVQENSMSPEEFERKDREFVSAAIKFSKGTKPGLVARVRDFVRARKHASTP